MASGDWLPPMIIIKVKGQPHRTIAKTTELRNYDCLSHYGCRDNAWMDE
jgi:hypothetical protein